MRALIAGLAAFTIALALIPSFFPAGTPPALAACVTLRDGSIYCDPTSTPAVVTDGTRPPDVITTVVIPPGNDGPCRGGRATCATPTP